MRTKSIRLLAAALAVGALGMACSSDPEATAAGDTAAGECTPPELPTITFAAYSTPREVYGKIITAFQAKWKEEHDDQAIIFQESYGASTTQAANVVNGFEADIVAAVAWPRRRRRSRTPA